MSGLCSRGFLPLFFYRSAGEITCVLSLYFIEMFFSSVVVFCHEGVPVCFSVQVHDAVGIGNAHPAALKGKVKEKWWKIGDLFMAATSCVLQV